MRLTCPVCHKSLVPDQLIVNKPLRQSVDKHLRDFAAKTNAANDAAEASQLQKDGEESRFSPGGSRLPSPEVDSTVGHPLYSANSHEAATHQRTISEVALQMIGQPTTAAGSNAPSPIPTIQSSDSNNGNYGFYQQRGYEVRPRGTYNQWRPQNQFRHPRPYWRPQQNYNAQQQQGFGGYQQYPNQMGDMMYQQQQGFFPPAMQQQMMQQNANTQQAHGPAQTTTHGSASHQEDASSEGNYQRASTGAESDSHFRDYNQSVRSDGQGRGRDGRDSYRRDGNDSRAPQRDYRHRDEHSDDKRVRDDGRREYRKNEDYRSGRDYEKGDRESGDRRGRERGYNGDRDRDEYKRARRD